MNLLFLAHRIPYPPNKGDKIRSWHALRAMVERGHTVHLLAFADDPNDLLYQSELQQWCASVEIIGLSAIAAKRRACGALVAGRPLSIGYYAAKPMQSAVGRLLAAQDFDAVFVYSSTMAQYVPPGLRARTVVDLVDVDSEKWRDYAHQSSGLLKLIYQLEHQRLRRYEQWIICNFARTVVTTAREAALLDGPDGVDDFTRRARLRAITNGVDLTYWNFAELHDERRQCSQTGFCWRDGLPREHRWRVLVRR